MLVQPGEYIVRRQKTMASNPAEVQRILADFREWEAWGQLQRVENSLITVDKESKAGPPTLTWSSEERFGSGKLTMAEVKPGESVRVKIDLEKPDLAQGEMLFHLEQNGYEVTVRWTITMQNSLAGKAQFLVSDRGESVGLEMEACLKRIQKIAEAWTKFRAKGQPVR